MVSFRIIAKLDIKGEFVIKGINFEGIEKLEKPRNLQKIFFRKNYEIIINDVNAVYLAEAQH